MDNFLSRVKKSLTTKPVGSKEGDENKQNPTIFGRPLYSYSYQNGKDNGLLCSEFGFR